MAEQLGTAFKGSFFGWGVGGADKMPVIAALLQDLAFRRVVGILDGNKKEVAERRSARFPHYRFLSIPAADVRSKPAVPARPPVEGLLDSDGTLREEHREAARALVDTVNEASSLRPSTSSQPFL